MMSVKHIFSISIFSLSVFLFSCGGNKQDNLEESNEVEVNTTLDSQKISAQNVFNSIPGRKEIIDLTQAAKAEYNAQTLNNPDNAKGYSLESSKALNLGVYGTDLNVTGVFEQTQESMLFLKCVNILAKSLGVSNAFDEKMVDRMEANKENRDSTMEIITQSFKKCDKFLVENGRPGTSSLIVAGAWVEGIYVACQTAKETKSEGIVKEIFSQKESLHHLIEMLQHSKVNADAHYLIDDLTALEKVFNSKSDAVYNLDAIKTIDEKITGLRTKVTSNK